MMKRKHLAAAAIVFGLLSIGVAGVDAYKTFLHGAQEPHSMRMGWFSKPSMPSPAVIREMEVLEMRMKDLLRPPSSRPSQADLRLFGHTPEKDAIEDAQPAEAEPVTKISWAAYVVTLAFRSGNTGFCVIDGNFYEQGATLPSGVKIARVERERVLLRHDNAMEWIPVHTQVVTPDTT